MSRLESIRQFIYPRTAKRSEAADQPRPQGPALDHGPVRGPNDTVRRLGRGVLWAALVLLLARGVGAIVSGSADSGSADAARPVAAQAWPDEPATAFAVRFATTFLSFDPRTPEFWTQTVEPFLSSKVDAAQALELPQQGSGQTAEQAVASGVKRISDDRALVTVAVRVVGRRVGTRYLAVPVARDRFGGLAVYDYPALVSGPARPAASLEPPPERPIEQDADAIGALVDRFVPAYLEGRDLSYFLADGSLVRPLSAPMRYRELLGLAEVENTPMTARRRTVVATVRAQDVATRAELTLRYRLDLIRGDRWVVQRLAG